MPRIVLFWSCRDVGLAVEVGGGGRRLDSNDCVVPLWAALAGEVSCRLSFILSFCLAACLVPSASLGGLGGLCPLAGVGDPGWKEEGAGEGGVMPEPVPLEPLCV